MNKSRLSYIGGAFLALGAAGWLALHTGHDPSPLAKKAAKTDPLPTKAPELRAFVSKNEKKADPQTQDQVGAARIRLAYEAARQKDWHTARATFLTAEREYHGSGAMRADFGGIPDQAAYQAAVCLVADGKKDEAKQEFVRFLKERPLSPLVYACRKRLVMLNGGKNDNRYDQLLQADVAKQEAHIRFETSVCGPKTIAYLLPKLGHSAEDYKALARLCGTTDAGTTVEGLRRALTKLGVASYAYRLNRQDLARAPLPAILVVDDHYVALLKVDPDSATVYDSRDAGEHRMPLPALDDPDFTASLVLFSKPEIQP